MTQTATATFWCQYPERCRFYSRIQVSIL